MADISLFTELFSNGPVDPRGNIPYYWCPHSTSDKFPQFSHTMMSRGGQPNSPWFNYFQDIIFKYLDEQKLPYKETIRACLNLTYHIPGYEYTDPHVDNTINHYVIILYLNDCDGNTIVFDKNFKIKEEFTPEKGKIICFDGSYHHALRLPSPGKVRNVCVFNVKY